MHDVKLCELVVASGWLGCKLTIEWTGPACTLLKKDLCDATSGGSRDSRLLSLAPPEYDIKNSDEFYILASWLFVSMYEISSV